MENDEEHYSQLELRLGPPKVTIKGVSKNNPIPKTGDSVLPHGHWIPFPQIQTTPQKRVAPASVVGWPPIRVCRKNLANGISSKPNTNTQKLIQNVGTVEKKIENGKKCLFVKINMDGIPIGRKVDLKAYDSYEKLSTAVDDLFRGLLAGGTDSKQVGEREITGLLDGSGEYTLVYEDNEGDKWLVGDVPWDMFVSAVKRVRVLKRSELSKLSVSSNQEKD